MKSFNFYIILLTVASLLLATCAAFFSVFGLSKLFAGAGLSIIIMASTLEFGKIVAVSYLNKFWSHINLTLRIYLLSGVVILMLLTSLGVYGYLSNAYQIKADEYGIISKRIEIEQNKKNIYLKEINDYKELIKSKNDRINQLSSIRTNQESRLNNSYDNKNYYVAKRTESSINNSYTEINLLNQEITDISKRIMPLNDSIAKIEMVILNFNKNDISAEIGPLRYISELSGLPMNKITNIFILFIIFVFDPLAMAFVISINKIVDLKRIHKEKSASFKLKDELTATKQNIDDRYEQITHGLKINPKVS